MQNYLVEYKANGITKDTIILAKDKADAQAVFTCCFFARKLEILAVYSEMELK